MARLPPEVARALYRLRRGQWPFLLPFLVLLVPGMAGRQQVQRKVLVPCEAQDDALVDLDAGTSRPLPAVFPDDWRREPCPPGKRIRNIRGVCFLAYGPPPCEAGYEYNGECVLPGGKAKPFPSSIQR